MTRIALHVCLWALYALAEFLANLPHYPDRTELMVRTLCFIPVIALPFYFVGYYLVPRLLWRGRKTLFWLACLLVFLCVLIIRVQWEDWYWYFQMGHRFNIPLSKVSKNLIRDYAVIGLAVTLKVIRDWDRKDRLATLLQQEKRDAELQFLRAQIHPHFLFNTLNNLYGLALVKSPQTANSILQLSGLLDFMLYECNGDRIHLEKEVALIQHYIELERLRFGKRLHLEFKHELGLGRQQIAPLLLLPFVENAFKHGASTSNKPVFIKIDLSASENTLIFQVENSRNRAGKQEVNGSKGIGLRNVEKRLQLLYPDRFSLHKSERDDVYQISLQLEL